jgi:hypothetical protein
MPTRTHELSALVAQLEELTFRLCTVRRETSALDKCELCLLLLTEAQRLRWLAATLAGLALDLNREHQD